MPLNTAGFKLALDVLTDATDGINYITVISNIAATNTKAITFAAATSTEYGGSVLDSSTPTTFGPFGSTETIQAIGLFHGTTQVGVAEVTEVTDTESFYYVVDSVTITNS